METNQSFENMERSIKLRKSKAYFRVIAVFVALCVFFAFASMQYYHRLQKTIRAESEGYLQEVSRRIGDNLNRIIDDNFAILHTMAISLEAQPEASFAEIQRTLQKQQNHWDYENVMLVDEAGKAYDLNNQEVFFTLADETRRDVLEGKDSMSPSQMINNQEYIIFCVPVEGIRINGQKMVAFAACYDSASFDEILSMKAFNEQAYSQIVTKSGTIVTRSSSEYAVKSGYNIFASLQKAEMDEESQMGTLLMDISLDRPGQIGFTLDGEHRYMVYTPIQPDDWYLLTFVPAQAINAQSDILLKSTLQICGLLTILFAALMATLFYIFKKNKQQLERIAYVDEVTGGNTIQRFYELTHMILGTATNQQYAMVYTNIEKFKVLNEQLGRESCDSILKFYNDFIQVSLASKECMGRLSADNFCLLLQFRSEAELIERLREWRVEAEKFVISHHLAWGLPATEFGIYVIENREMPFTQMIDRAKLSLRETPWAIDSKLHYAFYDDEVRNKLFREKPLEDRMEEALENNEFEVYLQPKHRLPEEKIGGAEALVRWSGSPEGMIYPNEFIPLFEKNGFIVKLDIWVYEEVCRTIRRWLDEGKTPIKTSVNCSRVHFRNANFLEPYIRIANSYNIDKGLIEIELTESVVFENTEQLITIINKIKDAGFGCSMDDFGSGYSALNLIQRIPVDTLKLDRIFFFGQSVDPKKTEAVVGNIVSMAKALNMETVAEGVEQREQVEMLKRAGCDYVQGFVFAKPVPIASFEEMVYGTEEER